MSERDLKGVVMTERNLENAISDEHYLASKYKSIQIWMVRLGILVLLSQIWLGVFDDHGFPSSISHSYHTVVGDLVFGALFAVGIFLVSYHSPFTDGTPTKVWFISISGGKNFWISATAGIGAIGVAVFPVDPRVASECVAQIQGALEQACVNGLTSFTHLFGWENGWHLSSAFAFFVAIGLLCILVFPNDSRPERRLWKSKGEYLVIYVRPLLYYTFGGLIFISCLLLIFAGDGQWNAFGQQIELFLIWEMLAVTAFTFAWLMKCYDD